MERNKEIKRRQTGKLKGKAVGCDIVNNIIIAKKNNFKLNFLSLSLKSKCFPEEKKTRGSFLFFLVSVLFSLLSLNRTC